VAYRGTFDGRAGLFIMETNIATNWTPIAAA
jgi:hypothetical protein